MKKFTKNQGITLIALIITIIVMLILVAVTINVALNGGLFTRAKEAAFKTEIQQIQEQISLKKAEQAADNEINGTTGYNITLDNIGISTELKNKYRNKLSVSSTGDLQYDPDNCTAEEIAYLTSIGAKSGIATASNKLEFNLKEFANEYDEYDVAKIILDDGNFYFYTEFTEDGKDYKINRITGVYEFATDTENFKAGTITTKKYYDIENDVEVDTSYPQNLDFYILVLKENNQIVNNVFAPQNSGLTLATTNGEAGFNAPDEDLLGNYTNEDDDVINIALSQNQTIGKLTIVGQTNVTYDIYIVTCGNKEYACMTYGIFEITRDSNSGTITATVGDEVYTKTNN